MIQLLALLIVQTSALANHAQYPATIQDIQCKELDFNSYHKVQNVKSNILRSNPERKRPNFAGKYLLLETNFFSIRLGLLQIAPPVNLSKKFYLPITKNLKAISALRVHF
jgi:hypothetical protein